ncbi:MAG: ubiquitin-like protein Pup [Acidimicrobiales bacterium mtb01]|nr:ubiquitin-like protein Pup [Actinomycetota bacterium]TEX45144.1 MAG: ubiquitin-like protein Pup [Acidimicrobiales bacterium mtb01]
MAERVHKQTPASERRSDAEAPTVTEPVTETGEKLKAELDELLDEIDEVLETNAEDFVKSYIQKGGE